MTTATWNGTVIAQSDETIVVEGNHYFPPSSVTADLLESTDHRTRCPWKGDASYFDIVVDGERSTNAAWTYVDPKDAASNIKDHVAFYPAVSVIDG